MEDCYPKQLYKTSVILKNTPQIHTFHQNYASVILAPNI